MCAGKTGKTEEAGRFVVCETRSGRYVQTFAQPGALVFGVRLVDVEQGGTARRFSRPDAEKMAAALPLMGMAGEFAIEEAE